MVVVSSLLMETRARSRCPRSDSQSYVLIHQATYHSIEKMEAEELASSEALVRVNDELSQRVNELSYNLEKEKARIREQTRKLDEKPRDRRAECTVWWR